MDPAPSVQNFLADPYGRYFCGRRHIVFAHSRTLIGFVSWGYPDVDDIRELLQLCEIGVQPGMENHRFLVDGRGLEFIDPRTFAMFAEYTHAHRAVLAQKLVRQALLRPGGLAGAIFSGFSHVARLSYPQQTFDDVGAAFAWLDVAPDTGSALIAELDALHAAASATDPTVRRMREVLATATCASLTDLAKRLNLSRRTCQRALNQVGTTFRRERDAARLLRARDLLEHSDRNLTWIAAELGYSSSQHFATAFRRATGGTPTAWRAQHGREAPKRASGD